MNALLLSVTIISSTIQTMVVRSYGDRTKNGKYIFNSMSIFCAAICCLISAGGKMKFTSESFVYGVAFAIAFGAASFFMFLAINEGSIALTTLVMSYSLLIPTFYGIIFLGDTLGVLAIIGIVLLVFSLYFSNYEKKSEEDNSKITVKWLIYITIAFVGNGMCATIQKIQNIKTGGVGSNEFMFLAYLMFAVAMLVAALIKERETILPNLKSGGVFIGVRGVLNAITNLLVIFLIPRIAASIMFPIISAGGALLTIIVAVAVYKEKMTRFQQIGVLLGILAIVFLNI